MECNDDGVDENNLIPNGDYEIVGSINNPAGWIPGPDTGNVLQTQVLPDDTVNNYIMLQNNQSISIIPSRDGSPYTTYILTFCGVVQDGQIFIQFGNSQSDLYPAIAGSASGLYQSRNAFRLDLQNNPEGYPLILTFFGNNGYALIDNVQLLPDTSTGEDQPTPEPTPSPTVPMPTPTPQGTPLPTNTPLPPLMPTPTSTPVLTAQSLQVIANPPMMVVSPDDVANPALGFRKQVELAIQLVGADGQPISFADILAEDDNAG